MEGWVKLHRCLIDKPIFDNANLLKVWIWCLCKATHKQHIQLVGLQKITLDPGQFIFGRIKASEELKIPKTTVWRLMTFLKDNESLDIKTNNKYSVVTVGNWASYQTDEEILDNKMDIKWTTDGQQMDTNKNVKTVKNEKNNIYTAEFEMFWSEYPKEGHQNSKPQSFKNFKSLVKKKVDPNSLIQAAKNYSTDCKTLSKTKFLYKASNFIGQAEYYKSYLDEVWEPAQQELFNKQAREDLPLL